MEFNKRDISLLKALADASLKRGDYESAARFFRHIAVHYGLQKDEVNRKNFSRRAGECYMHAAEKSKNPFNATMLYLKAAESLIECGDAEIADYCGLRIWENYIAVRESDLEVGSEEIHVLKLAGDFFFASGDLKKAAVIYGDAAEKSFRDGKLLLAGNLYRNAGDCSWRMGEIEDAANLHLKAADAYLWCQEYFEAAWSYCKAGFLFLYLGKRKEASDCAEKAEFSCLKGEIGIFLKDLSHVCRLLSKGHISEAMGLWNKVKLKLRKEYIQFIETLFSTSTKT